MEKIDEEDVDCFLLKMEQIRELEENRETDMGKWHRFSQCIIRIPAFFLPVEGTLAADIFWSENRPETMFLTEERTEGITLQELKEAEFLWKEGEENPLEPVKKMLEKLDDLAERANYSRNELINFLLVSAIEIVKIEE